MKYQLIVLGLLVNSIFVSSDAHSWLENPIPRDWGIFGSGNEIDNGNVGGGCRYTRAEGESMTYGAGYHKSRVHRGDYICIRHAANGHPNNAGRGYSRVSLSYDDPNTGAARDTESDFNCNVIQNNVDYAAFEGFKVQIPEDAELGGATLQWWWNFYGAGVDFTSCADIEIVDDNEPSDNLGLPPGTNLQYFGNCRDGFDPIPSFNGNTSPLLNLPECSGNSTGNGNNNEDTCEINVKIIMDTSDISVNNVEYTTNCEGDDGGDDGGDDNGGDDNGGDDGGDDNNNPTPDPPTGVGCEGGETPTYPYCCTDQDCPGTWCKIRDVYHDNGFHICKE